jgi:intracellular sulfur oxidation DsrE/DsrF family protein
MMMKKYMLGLFFLMVAVFGYAQDKKHRVVWDLSSADTASQAAVFRQINNARVEIPDLEIEVVFHGQAVLAMMKDSAQFTDRIKIAKAKGVTLAICNNSLRRLKIDPSQIKMEGTIVPSAVVELIRKQTDGWSYLKAH